METWSQIITVSTFVGVIFLVMTEWMHLTIAAFLGALLLIFVHVMTLNEAVDYISQSYADSSNIVAAGISELHGRRISFKTFLRYGLPVMVIQLVTAALYIMIRFFF